MANTSSAKKATRKIARKTAINKNRRSRVRTYVRQVEEALAQVEKIAGAKFGAVELGASVGLSYIFIALVWSVIFPLCFYLSNRFEAKQAQAQMQGGYWQ